MGQILIPAADNLTLEKAKSSLLDRSLLYNTDTKQLYVKYDNELNGIGVKVDNKNIVFDETTGLISLGKNISCSTLTAKNDDGIVFKSNILLGKTNKDKHVILLFLESDSNGQSAISGSIYEDQGDRSFSYQVNISSSGNYNISGNNQSSSLKLAKVDYSNNKYIALISNNDSSFYFNGLVGGNLFDSADYSDANISNIEFLEYSNEAISNSIDYKNENVTSWEFNKKFDIENKLNPNTYGKTKENEFYDLGGDKHAHLFALPQKNGNYIAYNPNSISLQYKGNIDLYCESDRALKLDVHRPISSLKIEFSYPINSLETTRNQEKKAYLSIFKKNNENKYDLIASEYSNTNKVVSYLVVDSLSSGQYFISVDPKSNLDKCISIYRVAILYGEPEIVVPKEEEENIEIDFTADNYAVNEKTINFHKDITALLSKSKNPRYTCWMRPNERSRLFDVQNKALVPTIILRGHSEQDIAAKITHTENGVSKVETGYCSLATGKIFKFNISKPNAKISVYFATIKDGTATTLELLDSTNKRLTMATAKYLHSSVFWNKKITGLIKLEKDKLQPGEYTISADNRCRIFKIVLYYPGVDEVLNAKQSSISSVIEKVRTICSDIKNKNKTYNVSIFDALITTSELNNLLSYMNTSEYKFKLDLSNSIIEKNGNDSIWSFTKRCGLVSLKLPQGFKKLTNASFNGCILLKSVALPESLENIEEAEQLSGLFSTTRVRTTLLPYKLKFITRELLINSQIKNFIIPDYCQYWLFSILKAGCFKGVYDKPRIFITKDEINKINSLVGYNPYTSEEFGKQIFKYGKITDFTETYKDLDEVYKKIYLEDEA